MAMTTVARGSLSQTSSCTMRGNRLSDTSSARTSIAVQPRPLLLLLQKAARQSICSSRRIASVTACATNGVEEAQGPDAHGPPADFYKVEAIVRPWRLSQVASSLIESGIRGVTVSDVRGFGAQGGSRERHAGSEFSEDDFVAKVKLEVVVSKDQVECVVDTIIENARTGEIGDGKIFLIPVNDVIRVRTGERGLKAERMAGGRADLLSRKSSN